MNWKGVSLSTPLACSFPFSDFTPQQLGKVLVPIVPLCPLMTILGNLVSEDFLEFCSPDLLSPDTSESEDWFWLY